MSSVQMLLDRNVFRLYLKDLAHRAEVKGIPDHRSCVCESTLSILVEFDAWNSHETSVCTTQRAGRLIERRQTSRQDQMNLC